MTAEDFIGSLDPMNPSFHSLSDWVRRKVKSVHRKGPDLVEILTTFCERQEWPHVDRKLGFIFGVDRGGHELLMNFLRAYHLGEVSSLSDMVGTTYRDRAWDYMQAGEGYYISCMEPDKIVARSSYKPDRFDRDAFLMFKRTQ